MFLKLVIVINSSVTPVPSFDGDLERVSELCYNFSFMILDVLITGMMGLAP